MNERPDSPDMADPFLAYEVERALDPYRGLLAAADLEAMRTTLWDVLTAHPAAAALVRRGRPLPVTDESGDYPVLHTPEGTGAVSPDQAKRRGGAR